jgi:hypothetical protein
MYICDQCHLSSKPREQLTRIVTEKRSRTYLGADQQVVGTGWEIVREINLCPRCAGGKEKS